jgi:hypothetical protein
MRHTTRTLRICLGTSLLAALLCAAPAAYAADQSSAPQVSRIESLEIPGLTAGCHICEWRPKPNQMPAAEQCGADDGGIARLGEFECGFSQDCQRECRFVRCLPP